MSPLFVPDLLDDKTGIKEQEVDEIHPSIHAIPWQHIKVCLRESKSIYSLL